jgi:hypothetical protein
MAYQLLANRENRNFRTASKNGGGDKGKDKSAIIKFQINYQQINLRRRNYEGIS